MINLQINNKSTIVKIFLSKNCKVTVNVSIKKLFSIKWYKFLTVYQYMIYELIAFNRY